MSSAINRVLADRAQNFTTAEQKIARDNIAAAPASAMSSYVSYSSLATGTSGEITGISGSAIGGGLGSVSTDANLTGSGTSGSPLGLSTSIALSSGANRLLAEPGQAAFTSDSYGGLTSYLNYVKLYINNASGSASEMEAGYLSIGGNGGIYTSVGASSTRYVPTAGVSDTWYSGISEIVDSSNPRTIYHLGHNAQQVDFTSIQKWNGALQASDVSTGTVAGLSRATGIAGTSIVPMPVDLGKSTTFDTAGTATTVDLGSIGSPRVAYGSVTIWGTDATGSANITVKIRSSESGNYDSFLAHVEPADGSWYVTRPVANTVLDNVLVENDPALGTDLRVSVKGIKG